MKVKILLLIFSLLFASMQFFGQGIKTTEAITNTSVSSMENLTMNQGINGQNIMDVFKSTLDIKEALKLKLTCDASAYSDEAIVVFNNSDPSQGAAKLMSLHSTAPELWSVKNGLNYTISFLGGLDSTILVPIVVKAGVSGIYELTFSLLESFGVNAEVSLEDRVSGAFINLDNTPSYTFQVSEPGTLTDRFYLRFVVTNPNKEITSVTDKDVAQDFNLYVVDGSLRVTSLQQQSGKVAVYDMTGRTIATGRVESGATTQINMHENPGVYIVSVLSGKGINNTKIIVK